MVYTEYRNNITHVKTVLVECIEKIAFEKFKQDRGYKIISVLPCDHEEYTFTLGPLSGYIETEQKKIYNLTYKENPLTVLNISSDPSVLTGIIDSIWNQWYNVFGENEYERGHPGEPLISKEDGQQMITNLQKQYTELVTDPKLQDLVESIKDSNYEISMKLLGVENTEQVIDPTVGHELHHLFAHGDISVYYSNSDIAVVKPDFNHELRRQIRSDQLRNRTVVSARGPDLEEAFVIGKDDTPIGLFAHCIDGTNLTKNSTITTEKIYNAMGFDKQYKGTEYAELTQGERMRIQGDLAIKYVATSTSTETKQHKTECYIPIDNHYIGLTQGKIPPDETKTTEPIQVDVPSDTVLNVSHDEHENITLRLDKGTYEFYLLPRGIRNSRNRPTW